jgi:hypothetical protein
MMTTGTGKRIKADEVQVIPRGRSATLRIAELKLVVQMML